jgi:DNA-binding NtrC family response regulator
MQEPIVVLDADEEQRQELCAVLERAHFRTTALHSLTDLKKNIRQGDRQALVLDLDNTPVDNLFFRGLRRENPGLCIIVLSSRSFHPELEEAMSKHIYACLGKPVDEEELVFWVKSLCDL